MSLLLNGGGPSLTDLLKGAAVLVIDDYQGMRTMLRNVVKELGIAKVDTVSNGKDALTMLSQAKYDVVICDFNLGVGQNGQQVLEEARLSKLISLSTIWIMVTAEKTGEMVLGAAEVKPDDYLLKPINQALLENRLKKLVDKKKSLAEIEDAIEENNYVKAIALCDQRLAEGVSQPQEILRIKSHLLLSMGAYDGARAVFEIALKERKLPWARTGLGKVLFHTRDYAGAKAIFQEVLEENKVYLEAADWLARALDAMGDGEQAQKVLQEAVSRSPNSSLRQKNLAETAYKNGALDVAQAAFEKTLKISEFSSHKNPMVFSGLAKVLSDKSCPEDALRVLDQSRKAFPNNPEATIHAAATESVIYQKAGQTAKAEAALANAEQVMSSLAGKVSAEVAMEMAQSYFKLGQKDKACALLENVIKNNHDDADISRRIIGIFEDADMGDSGRALIERSQQEVFSLNNEGVGLANGGKFKEAANLLRQSLDNLPNNQVIIMNLAGVLIGQMSREGKSEEVAVEVRRLLDRALKLNPANKRSHDYLGILTRMMGGR